MLQVRRSTFETNSSSTHSITMCSGKEYDKFVEGKVLYNNGYWGDSKSEYKDNTFVTIAQFFDLIEKDGGDRSKLAKYKDCTTVKQAYDVDSESDDDIYFEDILADYNVESYENLGRETYECFEERYTTPGGEEVVAFGYYGYDY